MNDMSISVVSLLIAVASLAVSIFFSWRSQRGAELQYKLQLAAFNRQYYEQLQRWGDLVVDALSDAIFLCDYNPAMIQHDELFEQWVAARQQLSALIDRGRWFMPNLAPDEYGQGKHAAYRGFRPAELDTLVRAYESLGKFNFQEHAQNRKLQDELWDRRKAFVSQMQIILDPRRRQAEAETLLKSQ